MSLHSQGAPSMEENDRCVSPCVNSSLRLSPAEHWSGFTKVRPLQGGQEGPAANPRSALMGPCCRMPPATRRHHQGKTRKIEWQTVSQIIKPVKYLRKRRDLAAISQGSKVRASKLGKRNKHEFHSSKVFLLLSDSFAPNSPFLSLTGTCDSLERKVEGQERVPITGGDLGQGKQEVACFYCWAHFCSHDTCTGPPKGQCSLAAT